MTIANQCTNVERNAWQQRLRRLAMIATWGLCKSCKWWQIEPDASIDDRTMGQCIDDELQPLLLRMSGSSGCNRYAAGKAARASGSSAKPPVAEPVR
jgi:hypothetical protein